MLPLLDNAGFLFLTESAGKREKTALQDSQFKVLFTQCIIPAEHKYWSLGYLTNSVLLMPIEDEKRYTSTVYQVRNVFFVLSVLVLRLCDR